jgi:hypothetical protein
MTKMIAAMTASERAKLADAVRAHVPLRQDGRVEYPARANAIQACVPRVSESPKRLKNIVGRICYGAA